jgi:serine/threonine protein kinase
MTAPVRIGPYLVERRLGGGGMAEVFLGSVVGEAGFSRPVAIKRVLPSFADRPEFASLFVSEAKLSSRLRHPNIVSVLDFQRDPEHGLFLVMELVEGKDLDQLLSRGPLPISLAIYIAAEMLRGLGYAHNLPRQEDGLLGLVHRDISPQNVLLSWEGEVKISDFGIAKSREAAQATASVVIKGKPAYMSPEQANGGELDGRSDLFATGVVLWQMLTGQLLFHGSTTQQVLVALLMSSIPPPTTLRPDIPADLCAVVMQLLERDVSHRYATAEAALHDLLACRDVPRDGRRELAAFAKARFPSPAEMPTLVAPSSTQPNSRLAAATSPSSSPAPAAVHASSKLGGWGVSRLWLLFVAVLLSAAALTVGAAALVTSEHSISPQPSASAPTQEPPSPQRQPAAVAENPSPSHGVSTEAASSAPKQATTKGSSAADHIPSSRSSVPEVPRNNRTRAKRSTEPTRPAAGIIEVQF